MDLSFVEGVLLYILVEPLNSSLLRHPRCQKESKDVNVKREFLGTSDTPIH
jgi:hypothetical protein